MTNSVDRMNEVLRNAKTLRRNADHFSKAKKHRYERRKVRSAIRLGDWYSDDIG